jgi:hypothetical protein
MLVNTRIASWRYRSITLTMTRREDGSPGGQGPQTWQPDLAGLSTEEQQGVIARLCSAHGTVVRVVVHRTKVHSSLQAFALVDMSDVAGADNLASAFSRPRIGNAVILLLTPLLPV